MIARTLMIQGASSSVGKSLLTAALCRIFARRGVRVAPFKAQNMSNNAAVCPDGSEIGRSQAMQAAAAGIEPAADMNPILLKPEADSRSQVIVAGRPWKTLAAREYYCVREQLWPEVVAALGRLRATHDLLIIEGAGSPAELNLRAGEIVNMAVARHARSPVLLVGDIDRGGVFAQLLGTLWLLDVAERGLVRGLVVNKFRGDRSLFVDGERILRARAELPVVGVVPFVERAFASRGRRRRAPCLSGPGDRPGRARRGRGQAPQDRELRRFRPAPRRAGCTVAVRRFPGRAGRSRRRCSARDQEHGGRPRVASGDGIGGRGRAVGQPRRGRRRDLRRLPDARRPDSRSRLCRVGRR